MNNSTRKKANTPKPIRIATTRKILRNITRKEIGSNKISNAWEEFQKKRYGEDKALKLKLQSRY
jgi:hypothetical protein